MNENIAALLVVEVVVAAVFVVIGVTLLDAMLLDTKSLSVRPP